MTRTSHSSLVHAARDYLDQLDSRADQTTITIGGLAGPTAQLELGQQNHRHDAF